MRLFIRLLVALSVMSVLTITPNSVSAHSGGTDEYGCHGGSESYHCHPGNVDMSTYYKMLKINGLSRSLNFKTTIKRYSSCKTLNRVYLRGVAKSKGKNSDFRQYASRRLYSLNKHLDVNKNGIACGFMESENSRITTKPCSLQSGVIQDGLSMATAHGCLMPAQPVDEIGGGWKVELLTRTPDAGLAIKSVSIEDTVAEVGEQFFIAKLRVTNLTGKTSSFPTRVLGARGESGRQYGSGDECPPSYLGIEKSLLVASQSVANGASAIGNVCWSILIQDVNSLRVTITTQRSCNCNMYTFIDRVIFISFA